MTTAAPTPSPAPPDVIGPAWDIATLFPMQGHWSESEYLWLTDQTNRLVELVDGRIEVLKMPTLTHQAIIFYLMKLLDALNVGMPVFAGLRVRMRAKNFRQPDITFLLNEHLSEAADEFWQKADLAVEVVSPDDPNRDYVDKRKEYARCGISEYWIVDPKKRTVIILELVSGRYIDHGPYTAGQTATSKLLPQFFVNVDALFEAGRVHPKA